MDLNYVVMATAAAAKLIAISLIQYQYNYDIFAAGKQK